MKRVNKILIGGNISSTASSVNAPDTADVIANTEIVILDKNKQLMSAGATFADTDTIYFAQALTPTFTDSNSMSRRPLLYSDPIRGDQIRVVKGLPYQAAIQEIAVLNAPASPLPVVGDEYVLRLVYTDMQSETPAQYVQEYHEFATDTTWATLYGLLAADVTADTNARVTAVAAATLTLTSEAIPFVTGNIDPYKLVTFQVMIQHIVPATAIPQAAGPTITYTASFDGIGVWQQVHDMEKQAKAYQGPTNYTWFPVPSFITSYYVDSTLTYDFITIDHDAVYASPDNNYDKKQKLTTVIAIPDGAAMGLTLLGILNPWIASCPNQFSAIVL